MAAEWSGGVQQPHLARRRTILAPVAQQRQRVARPRLEGGRRCRRGRRFLLLKLAAAGTDPEYDDDVFVRAKRELEQIASQLGT